MSVTLPFPFVSDWVVEASSTNRECFQAAITNATRCGRWSVIIVTDRKDRFKKEDNGPLIPLIIASRVDEILFSSVETKDGRSHADTIDNYWIRLTRALEITGKAYLHGMTVTKEQVAEIYTHETQIRFQRMAKEAIASFANIGIADVVIIANTYRNRKETVFSAHNIQSQSNTGETSTAIQIFNIALTFLYGLLNRNNLTMTEKESSTIVRMLGAFANKTLVVLGRKEKKDETLN